MGEILSIHVKWPFIMWRIHTEWYVQWGCRWGQFILTTDTGGTVDCGGNNGCEHSDILIHNAEAISCGGIQSCRHAHIVVINPVADHFSITCSGLHACHGLDIEVIIDDPSITAMDGILVLQQMDANE